MLVTVTNLTPNTRGVPTPANVSIPIGASETITFRYPKAFDWWFADLSRYFFKVRYITEASEIIPANPELDFTSLDEKIEEANQLLIDVKTSLDGTDILKTDEWVTNEQMEALRQAVETATNVKMTAEDQDTVDNAVTPLEEAISTFNSEKQAGTKNPDPTVSAAGKPSAEELNQELGSHQISDLIGEGYNVSFSGDTFTATGEVKKIENYDAFPEESKLTSYYVPITFACDEGNVIKATTLLGTQKEIVVGPDTMPIVFAIKPDSPVRKFDLFADKMAADARSSENRVKHLNLNANECQFEGVDLEPETPVVTTSVPEGSKTYYGKRADELQSDVTVKDTEITGTLKYAEGVQIMLHEPKYQEGNFLVLDFNAEPEETEIEVELQGGEPINPGLNKVDDGYCVFRITDKDTQKIHVVGTNGSKKFDKVYSLTNLTVEPKPVKVTAVKIAGQQQAFKGVTYSDLMSPDAKAQIDGKNINITGTLYKFTGDQLGTNAKDKNCAVVNITVDREGVVVTRTDNPAFSFTYTGKIADDFIIPLTSEKNTCELVFYPDAAHKESQSCGTVYTVDASGATLETRTKAEIAAPLLTKVEIPGQTESWKNVEYSKLMSPDTAATLEGNKIEVTGTLYKYENWDAFGEDLQNKNYLVLTLRAAREGVEMTFQKINGNDSGYTYPGDDLDFDLVLALDDQHKTVDFTFYANESDKSQEQDGQVYTLDCTKVTFSTQTQEEATAAAAASLQDDGPSMIREDQLQALDVSQLREMAEILGSPTTAKKASTIINKINQYDAADVFDAYKDVTEK